jgi:hypothetical protein
MIVILAFFQNPTFAPCCTALVPFFRRPYWTRACIIQELWLAEKVMVCCGHHKVAWPTICILFIRIIPSSFLKVLGSEDWIENDPIRSAVFNLDYLAEDAGVLPQFSAEYQSQLLESPTKEWTSQSPLDALECLTMSRR